MAADFAAVFAELKPVLAKHAKQLAVKTDSSLEYTLVTKSPSPFAQHKGQPMYFGPARHRPGSGLALRDRVRETYLLRCCLESKSSDWAVFCGAIGLTLMATVLASYLPARYAASIEPTTALRHE